MFFKKRVLYEHFFYRTLPMAASAAKQQHLYLSCHELEKVEAFNEIKLTKNAIHQLPCGIR